MQSGADGTDRLCFATDGRTFGCFVVYVQTAAKVCEYPGRDSCLGGHIPSPSGSRSRPAPFRGSMRWSAVIMAHLIPSPQTAEKETKVRNQKRANCTPRPGPPLFHLTGLFRGGSVFLFHLRLVPHPQSPQPLGAEASFLRWGRLLPPFGRKFTVVRAWRHSLVHMNHEK